jgi:hypothetical protein
VGEIGVFDSRFGRDRCGMDLVAAISALAAAGGAEKFSASWTEMRGAGAPVVGLALWQVTDVWFWSRMWRSFQNRL